MWRADEESPGQTLHALCHFAYAESNGSVLLAGLHAAVDWQARVITVVAPKFVSRHVGQLGPWDIGHKAVRNYFYFHPRSGGRLSTGYKVSKCPKHCIQQVRNTTYVEPPPW